MSKPHYPTLTNGRITSRFGLRIHPIQKREIFHFGLDLAPRIAGTRNVPIYAVRAGVVTQVFYDNGGGWIIRIRHSDENVSTGYHHLDKRLVKVGERVNEGKQIATMGTTGNSTGIHLHFEVVKGRTFTRVRKDYVDPVDYLNTNVNVLTVDGALGKTTTREMQRSLGTPVDGVISGQTKHVAKTIHSVKIGTGGSLMVRALQRKLGVTVDGYWGKQTMMALQRYLGTPQTGAISPKNSTMVIELQKRLNNGSF